MHFIKVIKVKKLYCTDEQMRRPAHSDGFPRGRGDVSDGVEDHLGVQVR